MWNCVLAGMAQTKQVVRVGHAFVKEPCIAVAASYPTRARCAVCLSHQPRVRVHSTSSPYYWLQCCCGERPASVRSPRPTESWKLSSTRPPCRMTRRVIPSAVFETQPEEVRQ